MKFSKCPECGNYEKGYEIRQCKKCGHKGCYKASLFSDSGCWTDKGDQFTSCPNCGEFAFLGHKILCKLGEKD